MSNLREVNDDILKDWLDFREDAIASLSSTEDKKHFICFEEISERILRNVPKQNKKYVERQLKQLDDNFFDYICYRNVFCDGVQLIKGCKDNNVSF